MMGVSAYFRVKGKKGRGGVRALDDVWAGIKPGITAMMGPSGAGKTSLLNVMAGRTENQVCTVQHPLPLYASET